SRLLTKLQALLRARYGGNAVHGILHRPIQHCAPELPLCRMALIARHLPVCCDLHGFLYDRFLLGQAACAAIVARWVGRVSGERPVPAWVVSRRGGARLYAGSSGVPW